MKVSNETQSHAADATRGRTATNRAKQGLRVTTASGTDIYPTHDIRVASAVDLGQNVTEIGVSPTGAAGGDLSGSFPSPVVISINGVIVTGTPSVGQGIVATSATTATWQSASGGEILISDTPSTPLIFADLLQNEARDDLVYSD